MQYAFTTLLQGFTLSVANDKLETAKIASPWDVYGAAGLKPITLNFIFPSQIAIKF